tara:strand:+ start:2608 stop:3147 length:540 start_codon:yes stop_codon:yes gene_type:complete
MDSAKTIHETMDRDSIWWSTYEYILNNLGKDSGSIFIITGKRGVGKTQMAACIVRIMCLTFRSASYRRASDMYAILKATFDSKSSELTLIDRWSEKPKGDDNKSRLMIIDDMQDRANSDWESRTLNQIVDRRYGNCLDTILITNEKRTNIQQTIGPSIISRADETGGIIECTWDSFRAL